MRTRKILAVIAERFLGSFCKNAAIHGRLCALIFRAAGPAQAPSAAAASPGLCLSP